MKNFLLLTALVATFAMRTSAQTYPLVSIHDLQFVTDQDLASGLDASIHVGDTVQVEGVVTFNPCAYGLSGSFSRVGTYLAEETGGAWNAVHVLIDPGAIGITGGTALTDLNAATLFTDNFVLGRKVKATGIVSEFQHNTQILLLPIATEITCNACIIPPAAVLSIDSFEMNDGSGTQIQQVITGEKYEGAYVEFQNVQVVDVVLGTGANTGRVFWNVQDAAGNKIQIRDMSGHFRNDTTDLICTSAGYTPTPFATPTVNETKAYIRGIINDATLTGVQQYTLAPLSLSDVGPTTFASPLISNVIEMIPVPTTSQVQTITAQIVDADGSIASATLHYSIGLGSSTFSSVTMTSLGANQWSGTIPATGPDSTYVIYFIQATDNDGHVTSYPNASGFNSYYLILNGGINSIQDIQYNPLGFNDSPYRNATLNGISVTGIVMAESGSLIDLGAVVLQDGSVQWSGISLANNVNVVSGPSAATLNRGDLVAITTAKVFEDFTVTKLDSITYTVVGTNVPMPAPVMNLALDSVSLGIYGKTEPYESMLLEYTNVFVTSLNPDAPSDFGEWSIYTSTAATQPLRVDDYSNDIYAGFNIDSLTLNQPLSFIRGILTRANGNWKLLPRNRSDIAGFVTPNAVASVSNYHAFDVYPNPVHDELRVRFVGTAGRKADWSMTDVTGRVINQTTLNLQTTDYIVPMENLSNGIYFIHVATSEGSQTVRVVKQ